MSSSSSRSQIKFLTYNVWSCEHVAVYRRIRAVCEIIERHDPYVVFLQHWMTADTVPRGLLTASVNFPEADGDAKGGGVRSPVRASTCRLVSPAPSEVLAMERGAEADLYLDTLAKCWHRNSVFGGDMSWDDDLDGPFPVDGHYGWVDAWCALRRPGGVEGDDDAGGWTYDAVANPMLRGRKPERKWPDRFLCRLTDYRMDSIQMVGTDVIPGVTYCDDKGNVLPVLPSHCFGLLLTISPKC